MGPVTGVGSEEVLMLSEPPALGFVTSSTVMLMVCPPGISALQQSEIVSVLPEADVLCPIGALAVSSRSVAEEGNTVPAGAVTVIVPGAARSPFGALVTNENR